MKTHHIFIALAAAMFAMQGCSDENSYAPGPEDAPDCMGVYFDADNQHDFIFVPGEDATVLLKMHRLNTATAADVPIVGKSSANGINFPASVHFDQGSADAELLIDCGGLPIKETVKFSVSVPDEYINHYSENLFAYESTALVSQWVSANADGSPVTFYFTADDYNYYNTGKVTSAVFQPLESRVEVLPGAGRIRVYNFINSDIDIDFELTPSPFADFDGTYRVSPLSNYVTMNEAYESDAYGDDWYNGWFLTIEDPESEDGWDYAEADLVDLDGGNCVLDYPMFYWYSNSYAFEYSYAKLSTDDKGYNSISMGFGGTPSTNLVFPSYFYVFFRWKGENGL